MSDKNPASTRATNAWKRWEMAAFDSPASSRPAPAATPPAPDPDLLRKEVEKLREAARARGEAEGFAAGHSQGIAAGTEEGHKSGHQEGYDAGYAAGHASGREEAKQEAERLQAMATSFADSLGNIEAEMGQALIALSIRIAEQVLRSTLDTQPEKLLDVVRDILQMDNGKEPGLRLRVSPADLALVQRFLNTEAAGSHWRLLPDPSITPGGCVAETALGNIDATLETRWKRVSSSLGHAIAAEPDRP